MKRSKGFTLIELMIVVAIIGILAAIAVPKFADLLRKANEGATKGNLGSIRSAISIYYGEQEGFFPKPTADGELGTILTMDNGKYLKEMPAAYAAGYHPRSSNSKIDATSTTDGGEWGYCESTDEAPKHWGDVWVNCTHTDTKATVWNSY